ncbi:protein kinase domain-containing protein [Micromonospora echinospora]
MIGQVLNGRYRLTKLVGEGGMGQLWKAHDEILGRDVAVKLISGLFQAPEAAARLHREARSAARLMSPHLAVVLDYGRDASSGKEYVVSEFVPGFNLHQVLKVNGPQEPEHVAKWSIQICAGLSVVHNGGVYHRDLKPHNVMLTPDGTVKLVDFGIAAYADAADYTRITVSGAVVGSPAYMPPERVLDAPVDHRSDLYSLGCTIYELLTGQVPFNGSLPAVLLAHAHTPAKAPSSIRPGIPSEWDAMVLSLLAKDPSKRPQSAAYLRRELERLTSGNRPGTTAQPPPSKTASPPLAPMPVPPDVPVAESGVVTGRVKWWNDKKGFGFLTPDTPGPDVFVHYSMLTPGCYGLSDGQRVSFKVVQMSKGPGAKDVRPL